MADVHAYLIEQGWLCVRQSSGASNGIGDCAITYCILCEAESKPDEALDVKRHEDHCPVPALARGWEAERLLHYLTDPWEGTDRSRLEGLIFWLNRIDDERGLPPDSRDREVQKDLTTWHANTRTLLEAERYEARAVEQ